MRWWLILTVAVAITLAVRTVWAQPATFEPSPFIYRLKISGCSDGKQAGRRQTGFRVEGMAGIVTALHGVVDCTQIHALPIDGAPPLTNLTIQAVDIDRDVALLTSLELLSLPMDGLAIVEQKEIETRGLKLIGYPLGLDEQDVVTEVSINYTRTLQSLIPDKDLSDAFKKRNSPNLAIDVFRVQAHLVPGHSGAPLLDSTGAVVAVANGGLKGGQVEMGWAMPWSAIKFIHLEVADKAVIARFNTLKTQNPQLALAFSSTYPPEIEANTTNITLIGTVEGVNSQPISGAEVTLTLIDAYYIAVTDDNGKYSFSFAPDALDKFREIMVESVGYKTRRQKVFGQLPESIILDLIRLARPIAFEEDEYIRVIWPNGIPLYPSPRDTGPSRTMSEGVLLQVIGGPQQPQGHKWWEVRSLEESEQRGWIVATSDTDTYVERLPFFIQGDIVQMTAKERRRLRQTPSVNGAIIGALEPGTEIKISKGPEEADGYLWYELQEVSGAIIGWIIAVNNEGIYLERVAEQTLTATSTPTVTSMVTPQPTATKPPLSPRPRPTVDIDVKGAGDTHDLPLASPAMDGQ